MAYMDYILISINKVGDENCKNGCIIIFDNISKKSIKVLRTEGAATKLMIMKESL